MTLEYLELMEDVKKTQELAEQTSATPSTTRRKLVESYKSNTRRYDDGSIEIAPQEKGEPSQKDVKKVGRSKRYATTGKNPLTCIELKCPEEVPCTSISCFFKSSISSKYSSVMPVRSYRRKSS